ncbi:MAG: hypothetical protein Q7N50_10195 [Armatimonadota bacterium]|nr:hypothetical protein [Armatimonadota bacterium]
MKELVSERTFNLVIGIFAVIGLFIGAASGVAIARCKRGAGMARTGLAIGSLAVVNWVLWRVYQITTDYFGLSSTRGLTVLIALFIVGGAALGILYARIWDKLKHF